MKTILKKTVCFTVITTLCLVVVTLFVAVGCEKSETPPKNVRWTPCKQNILKSSGLSDTVEIKFANKGVQITYYNFEVSCDFSSVNVIHTFVNGVLNITQQGIPNKANCICYTDVSYTINGISEDEVNVIFINGVQVYCCNTMDFKNIENLYAQPFDIIKKCVQGKWKIVQVSRWGFAGLLHPTNTIVNIDTANNCVIMTENEDEHWMIMNGLLNFPFFYSWERKEVYRFAVNGVQQAPDYTTYVMQNDVQKIEGWFFDKIINDTLHVFIDYHPNQSNYEWYLLEKINY